MLRGFATGFVNYEKGCTRLAAASGKVYQLLVHGRWFSPGTPSSSTTKIDRHDIVELLGKSGVKHQQSNQFKSSFTDCTLVQGNIVIHQLLATSQVYSSCRYYKLFGNVVNDYYAK